MYRWTGTFLLGTAVYLLIASPSLAAGFLIRENSATAVGMSYAGNGSRADGAETAFSNPAGLTSLPKDEFELGASLIAPVFTFHGSASAFGNPVSGNNGGNSGRLAGVPNLYGSFGLTDNLKAGLAVTVPFGNALEYDSSWYGRYLATKTAALSYDINPSLAWKLTDWLSLGAGISAQYFKLDVTSAIDQAVIFQAPVPDASNHFIAHDWALGFNLGALATVSESTRLGLTYRSRVDHQIKGSINFTGTSPLLGLINGPASSAVSLPATAGLSITSDLDPDLTISSDLQFSQWSVFRDIIIQSQNAPVDNKQNYRDSWMFSVGGKYKLNSRLTLVSGLAWDETPVTSRFRTVNLPDNDRFLAGLGTSFQWTDSLILDGAYGHSFALSHPNMNISINNTDPVTHAVVLKGQYDVAVDIASLSVHFRY